MRTKLKANKTTYSLEFRTVFLGLGGHMAASGVLTAQWLFIGSRLYRGFSFSFKFRIRAFLSIDYTKNKNNCGE